MHFMGPFGENAIFSMFICDVTTELMNINTQDKKSEKSLSFDGTGIL